jgi:hypothetical protein
MAFEEIKGSVNYVKYSEKKQGEILVTGRFVETYIDETYGKPQHKFQDDTGFTVLPGSGQLNYLMQLVHPGDLARVTYNGTIVMKDGKFKGKDAHQFKVSVDKDAPPASVSSDEVPF